MAKLTWEWSDRPDEIIISKKKGRITVEELYEFFDSRDAVWNFGEGALWVVANRVRDDAYQGWNMEKPEGDRVSVWVLGDESTCFCGRVLHTSYCPECGHNLWEEVKKC